jgi:drug/metabolite transporter (DMT)-like permease
VIPADWYWVIFVLIAAVGQTVRNAAQRTVSGTAGVFGATQVRFLYGLPFSILFFALIVAEYGLPPKLTLGFYGWCLLGAVMQVLGTAALLAAMNLRSFAVAVAYSRTEPVQIAIFGLIVLGDPVTPLLAAAVIFATCGVLLMSWPKAGVRLQPRPVALGVFAGTFFALSAIGFRAAIQTIDAPFMTAASTTLVVSLVIQTVLTTCFMLVRDRKGLKAVFVAWRVSLLAGFAGAFASQLWFFAFALETAAHVRTLGAVELLFAQIVSARVLREGVRMREVIGIALLIVGVVLVLNA